MKNNETCFGYTRVSTVKQGEGVSLEAQKEAIKAFAARNQLSIIKWFEEKETAAKSGRPVFSAMIKELHKGKASNLIIHKIDRSARNLADWAKIGDLSDAGINVHFATETLDFRSRGGRLTADIQAVIAADMIRNLKEETLKGMNGRLKQGLYPFKAPIGYVNNGGGKVKTIDPIRGKLVKQIFELYATNEYSLWMLVDAAKQLGLKNDNGKHIGLSCIERLLANPFYIGLMHIPAWGKTFEGKHKPLISVSLFNQVADVRAGKWVKKKTKHSFTYRRIFKCKRCSKAIIGEQQKGFTYYRCHTKGCGGGAIREEVIEAHFLQLLKNLRLPIAAERHIDSFINLMAERRKPQSETSAIAMQLSNLQDRKAALLDAYLEKVIDKETYEERHSHLLVLVSELKEKQKKTLIPADMKEHINKIRELFKSLYFTYSMAKPAEKRQIVEKLYANCIVDGKKLMIEPQNWLNQTHNLCAFLFGDPSRLTTRSMQEFEVWASELLSLVSQPETEELLSLVSHK